MTYNPYNYIELTPTTRGPKTSPTDNNRDGARPPCRIHSKHDAPQRHGTSTSRSGSPVRPAETSKRCRVFLFQIGQDIFSKGVWMPR